HGQMEDETVRSLLFSALRDESNPGSRLSAVKVLARNPNKDESIEEVLINALVYDENDGVRMQALEALREYAKEKHVRAAFMHTLANDDNPGIRLQAIDALTLKNSNDTELAKTIREVTEKDDNFFVRTKG